MEKQIIYMDAVLTPNASLSPRAFTLVMGVIAIISFVGGMAFLTLGFWPVLGFFGLDALAVWFAFRHSFYKQREETRVKITADSLTLIHTKPNGEEKQVTLPSAFARIELNEPVTPHSWLRIEHGQRAWVIGRFLTLEERKSLAEAMRNALIMARSERHFSQN